MPIEFYDPPSGIIATGTKEGVELGGSKCIISVDQDHNFYNEGNIYTEMSWGAFYDIEGLEDQIDTFETKEFNSIREDPAALVLTIIKAIVSILKTKRLFYGIADFQCNAFMSNNSKIPGLTLDHKIINKLMEAHKTTRDQNLFPDITETGGKNKIRIEFLGSKRDNLHFYGSEIIDLANNLNLSKGFATGIVCTSRGAANLYIMSDNIVFNKDEQPELYIDRDNIMIIEMGIEKKLLFPISWFRLDLGIKSFETLELWDDIKNDPNIQKALFAYRKYITTLVQLKYQKQIEDDSRGEGFENLTPQERNQALRDMAEAINYLTKKYKE